jgi:hypothetical protein
MRRLLAILSVAPFVLAAIAADVACSSSTGSDATDAGDAPEDGVADVRPPPQPDGGADADTDGGADGSCPPTQTMPSTGETCTGFGAGDPCDPACGLPAYGYVCFNGGPPGFTGCVRARASTLGDTYCCPNDDCVAEPDQDSQCAGESGKPHLYQCPPNGTDGGSVAPPNGCASKAVGGSPYAYACCP